MNPIALLPLRDWLYLAAIAAVGAATALFVHHEREIGAARVEQIRQAEHAAAQAVAASAIAASQTEATRRVAATLEIVNATQRQAAAVAADAASASAARDGLRNQLAAITASRRPVASNPGPGGFSAPTADATVVLADLLGRAADRATELARLADERGTAGAACVQQYDSLKPFSPTEATP